MSKNLPIKVSKQNYEMKSVIILLVGCTCQTNVVLSSTCIGELAHSTALGEYEVVCEDHESRSVYGHVDGETVSYFYYHQKKWLVSPQISDSFANIVTLSSEYCPEFIASPWNVYIGSVSKSSCL